MDKVILKGITWGHSRGIAPLFAISQRFSELHPEVEIAWDKRTLQEFADYPIEKLAKKYDLLIIDHPWVGCAAATGCVLPLEETLSPEYLADQLENSVGPSHQSYYHQGHQWALAIDAAAPVASCRLDLFEKHDATIPDTWQDVLRLAENGKLAVPGIPIDLLMGFYMFCIAHGNEPFIHEEKVIDDQTGLGALDTMKALWSLMDKKMFSCNPVAVAELMSSSDDYWYCPFAYGYSNYSRRGYAPFVLTCTEMVRFNGGGRLRSTLGGTGLAISSFTKNKAWSVRFAAWAVSPEIQSTMYVENGGQPGHGAAWRSEAANRCCNNFFMNTLAALNRAYLRPRYNGYLDFQDQAGILLQQYLWEGGKAERLLAKMNGLYRSSKIDTVKFK